MGAPAKEFCLRGGLGPQRRSKPEISGGGRLPSTGARQSMLFVSSKVVARTMPVWSCVSVLSCSRMATPQTETAEHCTTANATKISGFVL